MQPRNEAAFAYCCHCYSPAKARHLREDAFFAGEATPKIGQKRGKSLQNPRIFVLVAVRFAVEDMAFEVGGDKSKETEAQLTILKHLYDGDFALAKVRAILP